jgi:hypothetical protein
MVPKFQVATACFSCSPPDLNSSKLRSLAVKITKIIYVNTNFEIKAPRPLSQATASNHSNASTFTLPLTGRTSGRSLGTFSQTTLFPPPHNKVRITEELHEWESSGSRSRKPRLTAVGIRCADHAKLSILKIGTKFADKRRLLGRYSSIAD